jgi:DNA uptake protein ComE-like DNA-binding protein
VKTLMMLAVFIVCATEARAQVAHGLVDPNIAADRDMLALPNMTPAIVKELMAARPFMSVTELNTFLLGQKPTAPQAAEFYGKAFVHLNLNTGTREEILLIPGAGTRMAREFAEYRPGKRGRSSTRRSASTSGRKRPRGCSVMS